MVGVVVDVFTNASAVFQASVHISASFLLGDDIVPGMISSPQEFFLVRGLAASQTALLTWGASPDIPFSMSLNVSPGGDMIYVPGPYYPASVYYFRNGKANALEVLKCIPCWLLRAQGPGSVYYVRA